jgi:MYXO-CTERM domain-containing protein
LVVALASAGVIVVGGGNAVASTPLLNVCYDVGFACFNAGPAGDEGGTCVAATCSGVLDASYACGACEPGDGGGNVGSDDGGAPDAAGSDAGPGGAGDAALADGASALDGSPDDAAPADGNGDAEAGAASSGSGSSSGGSSSGSGAGASSGDEAPDAGSDLAPTMPGCALSPSGTGAASASVVALLGAAMAGLRRRRASRQ